MDSHATSRKVNSGPRLRVITRAERRRSWSAERKREIVEESLLGSLSGSATARKHDVSPGLLFTWRRQLLAGALESRAPRLPAFARVEVAASFRGLEAEPAHAGSAVGVGDAAAAGERNRAGMEIVLATATVRVDAIGVAARAGGSRPSMIVLAPGLRVYLACGVTDMRKGMVGLAMLVQQALGEDPLGGAVFAFRGRGAGLIKLIWPDGVGLCMLTKRLERGQFAWPTSSTTGRIGLSSAQLAALLDGCEWQAPAPRRGSELVG